MGRISSPTSDQTTASSSWEARLRDAITRLNPELPAEACDDAFNRLTRPAGSNLVARNQEFHPDAGERRQRRVPSR